MIKRIAKWIGGLLLFIVVLFAALFAYTSYKQSEYAKTAVPYIKKVVPIFSEWDTEKARPFFVDEAFDGVSEEEFERLFTFLSKLGEFRSMEEPKFLQVSSEATVREGANTIVTYSIEARYEHGEALVTIRLLDLDDEFEVYYFNVSSTALLN